MMSLSEFVTVTVHEVTSNKLCQFELSEKTNLSELRRKIQKEWGVKNFKFLMNGIPQAKQSESKKTIKSIINHGVLKIRLGTTLKDLSQNNHRQNQQLKQPEQYFQDQNKFLRQEKHPRTFKTQQGFEYRTFENEKIFVESKTFTDQFFMFTSNHQKNNQETQMVEVNADQQQKKQDHPDSSSLFDYKRYVTNLQSKLARKCEIKQMDSKLFDLDHSDYSIRMGIFLSFDWSNVRQLTLNNCNLNNTSWQILSTNAHMFSHLKSIKILLEQDIKQFGRKMQFIDFGTNKQDKNPLSTTSIKALEKYKQQNTEIKILFYKEKWCEIY